MPGTRQDRSKYKMLHRLFLKSEFSFAVSDLSLATGSMADLFFVSMYLGVNGITALGYAAPIVQIFGFIGTTVGNGSKAKVSSLLGAGNREEGNKVFSTSVGIGAGTAAVCAILVMLFCSRVALLLGARAPEVFDIARQYIYGFSIGVPFYVGTRILRPYLQLEGQYRRLNIIAGLTTAASIIGDMAVVFLFRGNMFGIAFATSIGDIGAFCISAEYFLRKKSFYRFSVREIRIPLFAEVVKLGSASAAIKGSRVVGVAIINNLLTALNIEYLVGAHGVFSQIAAFIRSAWFAPADSLINFCGVMIGEEDRESLKEAQRISLIHAAVYCDIITLILYLLAPNIAGIFLRDADPAGLELGTRCIRVACFSIPLNFIVYNFYHYLITIKRVRFNILYSFLIECGSLVPITLLLLRILGYTGAWIAMCVNSVILSAIALLYIALNKEGEGFREKMLLMPSDFGFTDETEMDLVSTSPEDIEDLSKAGIAFALENGADKKRARTYGLITEELAGILVQHGFDDGKPHNIWIRFIAKGEDLIIRLRDDCRPFNVTEYYQLMDKHDEKEIGLLIIMGMAKDIRYTTALGANNLIIRI